MSKKSKRVDPRTLKGFQDYLPEDLIYRKRVIRTQRFSSLTSPLTEVFSGFLVILIIWAGTRPGLIGLSAPLAPEAIIVFLMAALKLTSPLKTIASFPAVLAVTMASAEKVFEFLDQPPTEVDRLRSHAVDMHGKIGIMFSSMGVTGDNNNDGWGKIRNWFLTENHLTIVITLEDLRRIQTTLNPIEVIERRQREIYISG